MKQAARDNTRSAIVAASFDGVPVAGLATAIRVRLPYAFDPQQQTMSWDRCLARGYAACGDAAALVTALAARRGDLSKVRLCFEEAPDRPEYLHVKAIYDGVVVDPYPEETIAVQSCARSLPGTSLLPSHARMP